MNGLNSPTFHLPAIPFFMDTYISKEKEPDASFQKGHFELFLNDLNGFEPF